MKLKIDRNSDWEKINVDFQNLDVKVKSNMFLQKYIIQHNCKQLTEVPINYFHSITEINTIINSNKMGELINLAISSKRKNSLYIVTNILSLLFF